MTTTETLIHFTDSFQKLENIVLDKFYGSYCKEKIYYKDISEDFIVPMISFCDIPLTEIKNQNYGKYAIGLKKAWGIKNGLNPVLYIEKKSFLAKSYLTSMDNLYIQYNQLALINEKIRITQQFCSENNCYEKNRAIKDKLNELNAERSAVSNSIIFIVYSGLFTKHYQDDLFKKNGEIIKDFIFYKEREWRYVPESICQINTLLQYVKDYDLWRNKNQDKRILKSINLAFEISDINYIILEYESEVDKMTKVIDDGFKLGKLKGDKSILISKLLSYERIVADF